MYEDPPWSPLDLYTEKQPEKLGRMVAYQSHFTGLSSDPLDSNTVRKQFLRNDDGPDWDFQPNHHGTRYYSSLVAAPLSMELDPTLPINPFDAPISHTTGQPGGSIFGPSRSQNNTFSHNVPTSELGNPSGNSLSTQEVVPSTPNIFYCDVCSAEFKGQYAVGNLGRHKKTYHGGEHGTGIEFACEEEGCDSTFKRRDARLKHYRHHHPKRTKGPAQSRKLIKNV
jgi:hypothetical protein